MISEALQPFDPPYFRQDRSRIHGANTHASSFGKPNQNVPTTTTVKRMNSTENLMAVTNKGPSYHLPFASVPLCSARRGVASPSSAANEVLEFRRSRRDSWITCSGMV